MFCLPEFRIQIFSWLCWLYNFCFFGPKNHMYNLLSNRFQNITFHWSIFKRGQTLCVSFLLTALQLPQLQQFTHCDVANRRVEIVSFFRIPAVSRQWIPEPISENGIGWHSSRTYLKSWGCDTHFRNSPKTLQRLFLSSSISVISAAAFMLCFFFVPDHDPFR